MAMMFYKKKPLQIGSSSEAPRRNFNNSKFVEVEVLPVDESFNRKTQSKSPKKKPGMFYDVDMKYGAYGVRDINFSKTHKEKVDTLKRRNELVAKKKQEVERVRRDATPLSQRTYKVPLKKLGKYKHHKVDKEYSYKSLRQKSPMGEPLFGF